MKLVRTGAPGEEKLGVLDTEGRILDLSAVVPDWSGETLAPDILQRVRAALPAAPVMKSPGSGQRFGPPVSRPGKVVCIGVNYADHAAESDLDLPTEPVVFMKAANAVVGPHDTVLIPRGSSKTDWEVELAVVVGEIIRYLSQFMVLEPGDVINTGTPSGVALGFPDPKPYLRPGDVIDLEIEGLGHQRQELRSA